MSRGTGLARVQNRDDGPWHRRWRTIRKWGRPCGRPHSHRRVVFTEAKNLTPGVFRPLAVRQRCYVARRSRRCRFRRGTDEVRKPPPNLPAVPRPVNRPCSSSQAMRGTAQPSKPAGKPGPPTAHPRSFNGSEVARVRRHLWLPFLHPAASRRRVEGSSKIPSSFRVLPRPFEEPIPALDGLKMLAESESGNGKPADLSTFAKIASGQQWITQLPAAIIGTYPRSRLAKRRSRRALSLMKPSASCWS